MIYVYKNSAGETREIVASMKNPPPEVLILNSDGSYLGCNTFQIDDPAVYRRDYSNGGSLPMISTTPDGAVNHAHRKGKLPVSGTLPRAYETDPRTGLQRVAGEPVIRNGRRVRLLKSGAYATMDGRRIVDSNHAADLHCAETGYQRARDE